MADENIMPASCAPAPTLAVREKPGSAETFNPLLASSMSRG